MSNEVLTEEESRRIKEFKALYYELNAKPDTTTKIYNNHVIVKMQDLIRLETMVREKLGLHNQEGKFGKTYITVATSKHKVFTFDDWKLFIDNNWNIRENVENITLVWDFYISVEGYKNPQRHKLTVKISSGLKPEEMLNLIFSGKVEDMQNIDAQQAPIIAQMDFIDGRLGQEFLNLVTEWVDVLDKLTKDKSKSILFLKKKRKVVGYYLNYTLFFILCITLLIGLNCYIISFDIKKLTDMTIENLRSIINYIVISILSCSIVLNVGENIANSVFRRLSDYGESFVFRITKGDEMKYVALKEENDRNALKIAVNLFVSLILNVGCGILASVIYSKL